jgi:hypothetical protein
MKMMDSAKPRMLQMFQTLWMVQVSTLNIELLDRATLAFLLYLIYISPVSPVGFQVDSFFPISRITSNSSFVLLSPQSPISRHHAPIA